MEAAFLAEFRRRLDAEQTVAIATIVEGSGIGRQLVFDPFGEVLCGDLGSASLNDQVRRYVSALVPGFRCEKTSVTTDDGDAVAVFIEVHGPRPQLVVVGAVHVAVPLLHFARILGWRTVVVDPRPVFASAERFGHADVLLVEWPHEAFERIHLHDNTYVAVLSHDLKIDIPAIAAALRRRLPYVGALGSKKTQAKRVRALVDDGFTEADLASLRSPIGLDLGGRRAEDVALAIIAEIVAVTQDGSAARQVRSAAG